MSNSYSWATHLRDIADFPKPGIVFKDITPLLGDGEAFKAAIEAMSAPWRDSRLDAVLGIESRGFILGAAMAHALCCGFVPVRKPGKLPAHVLRQEYALEYGSDCIEVHADALAPGARVLLVDGHPGHRRHLARRLVAGATTAGRSHRRCSVDRAAGAGAHARAGRSKCPAGDAGILITASAPGTAGP